MQRPSILVAATVVVLSGCMGTSGTADPVAFEQLTQDILVLVEAHRTNSAIASTVDACRTEFARYDTEVRPPLEKAKSLSGGMDDCMMHMGRGGDADLETTCGSMMTELDTHKNVACTSTDQSVNKAEAVRHCDALKTWLGSAKARAGTIATSSGSRCR